MDDRLVVIVSDRYMVIVVASEGWLDHQGHGFGVGPLCQGPEKQWIEEVEPRMDHFAGALVEDIHLEKGLVDLGEDLVALVVAVASRVVGGDLAHLVVVVVVVEERDLDLLEKLDRPLYPQKDCLDHVRSMVVLEMERRVVVDHPWQEDEKPPLEPRAHGEVVGFLHHIFRS